MAATRRSRPGFPPYSRDFLRSDLISGVTFWGVMVPVAMAYAQIVGMPPEIGLYAAFAALLAYAIFGTSRHATSK